MYVIEKELTSNTNPAEIQTIIHCSLDPNMRTAVNSTSHFNYSFCFETKSLQTHREDPHTRVSIVNFVENKLFIRLFPNAFGKQIKAN